MNTYDTGFDFGNGEATVTLFDLHGQLQSLTVPSVTAEGTLSGLQEIRGASGAHDHPYKLYDDDYILSFDGEDKHIGRLALVYSSDPHETRNDINRYWSKTSLEFLLTLSGSLIFDREFTLNVVTGLPAETYSTLNKRQVKEALEGDRAFWLNGTSRMAHIKVAKVVQEGAGGIVLYGTKEPVKQAIIDIGERTTDIFTARGQEPIADQCKGRDKGVANAAELLNTLVYTACARELTIDERRRILRAHVSFQPYPDIPVAGRSLTDEELRPWAETALRKTGKFIRDFTSKVLKSDEKGHVAADLKSVILIGGGAYYFLQDIQERIPFAKMGENPEYANSRSYAHFARRFAVIAQSRVSA